VKSIAAIVNALTQLITPEHGSGIGLTSLDYSGLNYPLSLEKITIDFFHGYRNERRGFPFLSDPVINNRTR